MIPRILLVGLSPDDTSSLAEAAAAGGAHFDVAKDADEAAQRVREATRPYDAAIGEWENASAVAKKLFPSNGRIALHLPPPARPGAGHALVAAIALAAHAHADRQELL